MYKLIISRLALNDISQATAWYENQQDGLGERFIEEVERSKALLTSNPFMFSKVNRNTRHCMTKRFPYGIFYRINESKKQVRISAVVHAKRHPRVWQSRR